MEDAVDAGLNTRQEGPCCCRSCFTSTFVSAIWSAVDPHQIWLYLAERFHA